MNSYQKKMFKKFLEHFKKLDCITIISMTNDIDFVIEIGRIIFFLYINPKNCIVYSALTNKDKYKDLIGVQGTAEYLYEGIEPHEVTAHMMKKGAMTR